jgi:hypothetical protein
MNAAIKAQATPRTNRKFFVTLKIELERMRIDVVGRHHSADQGIGENIREGEAVRAFLASAAGEQIHRFPSCRDHDFKS